MNLQKTVNNLEETTALAKELAPLLNGKIVFLNGNLGAGKTTLVKSIVSTYGATDQTSSPTFTIMQEYHTESGKVLHYDLYRLNNVIELENTGFFDEIEQEATVFIEWADKFKLKDELETFTTIQIDITGENSRNVKVQEG